MVRVIDHTKQVAINLSDKIKRLKDNLRRVDLELEAIENAKVSSESAKVVVEKALGEMTIAREETTARASFSEAHLGQALFENVAFAQLLLVERLTRTVVGQALAEAKG